MNPGEVMLDALARYGPLNKYQLEKYTRRARQSIYDWIPRLKSRDCIKVDSVEQSRTKRIVEYYGLTETGWVRAVAANPKLATRVPDEFDGAYEQRNARISEYRVRDAEKWSQVIRDVLASGRAAPSWHLKIEIWADKDGRIRSYIETGFPVSRRKKRNTHTHKGASPTRSKPTSA